MDATPKARSSRRNRKGKKKTPEKENTYAAPQQPEYWDATLGQWVQRAPARSTTQPKRPAQRRARRINPAQITDAQPYDGPRPDADWEPPSSGDGALSSLYQPDGSYASTGRGFAPPMSVPPYMPDSDAKPKRKRRTPREVLRNTGKTVKWIIIVLLIIALVEAIAVAIVFSSNVSHVDALSEHMIGRTSGTNWLLVGSDSRSGMSDDRQKELQTGGELGSQRTDTIMIMHIPYGRGQRVLISVPRDSYVNIPGYGMGKINSSFALGGPQLLVKTIEQAAGVHINHYMEIGLGGFANMADAINGVEICPTDPISDPYADLYIKAGCQIADGKNNKVVNSVTHVRIGGGPTATRIQCAILNIPAGHTVVTQVFGNVFHGGGATSFPRPTMNKNSNRHGRMSEMGKLQPPITMLIRNRVSGIEVLATPRGNSLRARSIINGSRNQR